MNKKSILTQSILVALILGTSTVVNAQSAEDFHTDEYKNLGDNALDIINADKAYAKGYTGKNVILGVCDQPTNFASPEFNRKENSELVDSEGNYDWSILIHGTHVSGIVAGDKNNLGSHGVAFNAEVKASNAGQNYQANGYFEINPHMYDYYLKHSEIKIINNSWAEPYYLSSIKNKDEYNKVIDECLKDEGFLSIKAAAENDKLLIFSAGNSGHTMPSIYNTVSNMYKKTKTNIISVTAGNSTGGALVKNSDGSINAQSNGIAIFSDLTQYREDYMVSAPGQNINAANANFASDGKIDEIYSGTSMAAPMVTGVGGLVQQAHPYMNSKQLGDVLLSTANNNINAVDGYFVTLQEDFNEETNKSDLKMNIFYTDGKSRSSDEIHKNLAKYYRENSEYVNSYFSVKNEDEFFNRFDSGRITTDTFYNVPIGSIFGQGIVDANKAVNGLGAINVRRLDKTDISENYTVNGNNETQALYKIDTKGYSGVWSNDIKEIRVGYIAENPLGDSNADFEGEDSDIKDLHDRYLYYKTNWIDKDKQDSFIVKKYIEEYNKDVEKSGLIGLHAGVYKQGEGILNLTGNNTYKGSSIVAEGTLQIDGSIAGDAYSINAGKIAGKGTINGNLYNGASVEGGSYGSADTLNIKGDFNGEGTIGVNSDGNKISSINVENTADISKMDIKAGTKASPNVQGNFITAGELIADKSIDNVEREFSGLLNGKVSINNNSASLSTVANNNTGVFNETFNALNNMYGKLANAGQKEEMQYLYAFDKDKAILSLGEITGGMQANLAHDIIKNRDVISAINKQTSLDREDSLWILNTKHWNSIDNVNAQGYSFTIGKDFTNDDEKYWGILFNYSNNSLNDSLNSGEYDSYNLGLYGGTTKNRANTLIGYLSYGIQDNDVTRNLLTTNSKLKSSYDSSTIGLGVKYSYDLDFAKEDKQSKWHKSPYAKLDMTYYDQKDFKEQGRSVYAQQFGDYDDTYVVGEIGISFDRSEENGSYGLNLGYKRIIDGSGQDMEISFVNDRTNTQFKTYSVEESKDHFIVGGYVDTKLSEKWSLAGQLEHDWSSNSKDLSASINFNYQF